MGIDLSLKSGNGFGDIPLQVESRVLQLVFAVSSIYTVGKPGHDVGNGIDINSRGSYSVPQTLNDRFVGVLPLNWSILGSRSFQMLLQKIRYAAILDDKRL